MIKKKQPGMIEPEMLHLIFYKDGGIIVNINLLKGHAFLPTVESIPEKDAMRKAIGNTYSVIVSDCDLIVEKKKHFCFIGEWEGTFLVRDDAVRTKWVDINEFPEKNLLAVRRRYRDIVDTTGETIGIASSEEAKRFHLRTRELLLDGKKEPLFLGERPEHALKRLKLKKQVLKQFWEKESNTFCYQC